MDLGLKDKVVVCMSSASGFGKGIATEFAREGAKVVICTSEAFKAELDQAVVDIEKGDWQPSLPLSVRRAQQ